MIERMPNPTPPGHAGGTTVPTCPTSGTPGRAVKPVTVRSLVLERRRVEADRRPWFFCDAADCDVVYFTADGARLITADLNVRVGLKETGPPRPVCYCFGHTLEEIEADVLDLRGAADRHQHLVGFVALQHGEEIVRYRPFRKHGRSPGVQLEHDVVHRQAGLDGGQYQHPLRRGFAGCVAVQQAEL